MAANRSHSSRSRPRRGERRGSVLLLVLIVVAMLTLGTATYLELMQNERMAVRHHGRGLQAERLAESGVEYARTLVGLTPAEILQSGGLANNPTAMQAIIVDDEGDEFDRGRFSVISPAQVDGYYSGYRFGLENESAKLNINALLAPGAEDEAANRLLALPGMTAEIADAILDWLDSDVTPRTNGAEAESYAQLTPSYEPRNGPISDLDELLQVRGVTPELLYGVDQNRNFVIDANETPRGQMLEIDNADGYLNRGWSAYLTTTSIEAMQPSSAAASTSSTSTTTASTATPLQLNGSDLQQLYNSLSPVIGEDKAKFFIAYRQYGAYQDPQQQQNGQVGSPAGAGGASGNNQQSGGNQQGGQSPNGSEQIRPGSGLVGQDQNQQPVEIEASAITLNFQQQGQTQINSPLDLVGVRVQIPAQNNGQSNGQNNGPPQNVTSPWAEDPSSYRELLKLYDAAPPTTALRVAGRVNVNQASRFVLQSIPSLPDAAVGKIISRREAEPDPAVSEQRHALWLLIDGVVTLDEMRQIERYVTTGGDAFSGQSIGFFDAGPAAARQEFVVDRSGTTPHLRLQRDLTPLGRGFSTLSMGVESSETP